MRKFPLKISFLVYIGLVLLSAAVTSQAVSGLALSVTLLAAVLFTALRRPSPGLKMVIDLAVLFLTPLALGPGLARITTQPAVLAQVSAVIIVLPVYYLLDLDLREHARSLPLPVRQKGERNITATSASLLMAALVVMALAPLVNRPVLLVSGLSLIIYLLGGLVRLWRSILRLPFSADVISKNIIAGTKGSALLYLNNQATIALRAGLQSAVTWIEVTPPEATFRPGRSRLDVRFTPPLAGQSRPQLKVTATDRRGLVRLTQTLEPLEFHIIPRARYAEWLASKYLEQATTAAVPEIRFRSALARLKRGSEYHSSRSYQPGDPLRDIDWKHTLKLSQLIIRELGETGEPAAIIAVNLAVADDDEADEVAFNLITAALTMARENIPTALAAYNHQQVILSQGITEQTEILRQALALVREITVIKFTERYLEPIDIARVRRNISQLRESRSEPAKKLLEVLDFEHRAIEQGARDHPATLALMGTARQVPPPAMILLISRLNHDAEAVLMTIEKLARRRYTTMSVAVG